MITLFVVNASIDITYIMNKISTLMVTWLLACRSTHAFPLTAHSDTESLTGAMMYLMKYGYMDSHSHSKTANLLSRDGLKDYIMQFQEFAGLPLTGELDNATVVLMNTPRCGVKDIVGKGVLTRKKRYALQGSRWKTKDLTYKISKYPSSSLTRRQVEFEIQTALDVWSSVTDLTFTPVTSGRAHIDIRFESREHGDGDTFDGPGGTLAHAYFPVYGGDVHFDDDETWTVNTYKGTNLLQTAAHEFGHSLGLSHSDQYKALMAPFYRGYEKQVRLENDDIQAIQSLYGKKSEPIPSITPTSRPSIFGDGNRISPSNNDDDAERIEICNDPKIDTIVTMGDGITFAFKGNAYWKLTDDSIAPGYPRSIARDWQGLPDNLDAAFTWTDNKKTYFFKGEFYWRFSDNTMDPDYPKLIRKGFPGIPNDIDGSFVWSGNGKIYFFKGNEYWRFDPEQTPAVKPSYPRDIANWEGIPPNIDDALQYTNGYTYFFKDGKYYRFNDISFKVDEGDPPFPRPAGYWWFGCDPSPSRSELKFLPSMDADIFITQDKFDYVRNNQNPPEVR